MYLGNKESELLSNPTLKYVDNNFKLNINSKDPFLKDTQISTKNRKITRGTEIQSNYFQKYKKEEKSNSKHLSSLLIYEDKPSNTISLAKNTLNIYSNSKMKPKIDLIKQQKYKANIKSNKLSNNLNNDQIIDTISLPISPKNTGWFDQDKNKMNYNFVPISFLTKFKKDNKIMKKSSSQETIVKINQIFFKKRSSKLFNHKKENKYLLSEKNSIIETQKNVYPFTSTKDADQFSRMHAFSNRNSMNEIKDPYPLVNSQISNNKHLKLEKLFAIKSPQIALVSKSKKQNHVKVYDYIKGDIEQKINANPIYDLSKSQIN